MKHGWILGILSVLVLLTGSSIFAADQKAAPAAPPAPTPTTQPAATPVPQPAAAPVAPVTSVPKVTILQSEQEELKSAASRASGKASTEGLKLRPYSKRLPKYFGDLDLTKKQKEETYKIQKEYYDIIAVLQARIERLRTECDEKMSTVLTADQKKIYDDKVTAFQTGSKKKSQARQDKMKAEREAKAKAKAEKKKTNVK